MLAYPSTFIRLTTGLDFTTSVFELPCASSTFLTVNTVCADCITCYFVSQPTDITLQVFFFLICSPVFNCNWIVDNDFLTRPLACCSVLSECPSTPKTTQHPDPSIDPQVDPSHPSPHPSFPLCSSNLISRSKYWSASGPSLLGSPFPPISPMILTMIYLRQAYFIDCP